MQAFAGYALIVDGRVEDNIDRTGPSGEDGQNPVVLLAYAWRSFTVTVVPSAWLEVTEISPP